MMSIYQVVCISIGILFTIVGISLFIFFRVKGYRGEDNKIAFFSAKFQVSTPSLVIFIVGTALMVSTLFMGEAKPSFSFSEELCNITYDNRQASYYSFVTVEDDSCSIRIDIPRLWKDILGTTWVYAGEEVGPAISASPILYDYDNIWSEPGVFFGASSILAKVVDVDSWLDLNSLKGQFVYEGRFDYENPLYAGKYDLWSDCGGVGTSLIHLAAVPDDNSFIMWMRIQMMSDADVDALDNILETFTVLDRYWETWD